MSLVALSELLGTTVRDVSGSVRGRVREVAIEPQAHGTRVAYLIVKTADGERVLPAADLKKCGSSVRAETDLATWERSAPSDGV
ncbi:MAG TPA: PRC-barrel domain-containing protein, partial [Vicinamibacterales bacterium]|nr:PRC-barrel domain-containing protein [Vicinamibacterales bacterium]